ncbi:MAG: hypothetical protein IJ999_04575 [Clostridia bacterium]|nr:hypothetical protein [Clostridia bacterium]
MKNKMICPNCGNDENFAMTETKKGRLNIWVKLAIHFACIVLFVWGFVDFKNSMNIFAFIATVIVWIIAIRIIKAIDYQRMRKTSTKVICERCGKTWFID